MRTTLAERIIGALEEAVGPLTDAQLAAALNVAHQAVNQTCRTLDRHGVLTRQQLVGSSIVNILTGVPLPAKPQTAQPSRQLLAEDDVKTAVRDHLKERGYVVKVAWGHEPGIDIEATGSGDHLLIEAKGEAVSKPQQANYFVGALGELVQRFAQPRADGRIVARHPHRADGLLVTDIEAPRHPSRDPRGLDGHTNPAVTDAFIRLWQPSAEAPRTPPARANRNATAGE